MNQDKPLHGKVAIVTGASTGIGLESARLLLADGAAVMLLARNRDTLETARNGLLEQVPDGKVAFVAGDACDEQTVKTAIDQSVDSWGGLDILVATVGGGRFRPILQQDASTFRAEFELNVISAFLLVRYGAAQMKPNGSIVCVSAVPVIQPFTGISTYLASKAALERFVQSAADELGRIGVRINSVRPGLTRSRSTDEFFADQKLVDEFAGHIPLGRAGLPVDVARVIRFLAGPESGWVTGQNVSVDGGQSQRQVPDLLAQSFEHV